MSKGIRFEDYFSLEQFIALFENHHLSEFDDKRRVHDTALMHALQRFLADKAHKGEIFEIAHSQTHRINLPYMWNGMIKTSKNKDNNSIKPWENSEIQTMAGLIRYPVFEACDRQKNIKPEKRYRILVDGITKGDGTSFIGSDHYCHTCGETFGLSMNNWQMTLQRRTVQDDWKKPVVYSNAPPCHQAGMVQVPVTLKTGHLLVSDWFRIEAFTQATDDKFRFDINSVKGHEEHSLWMLKEFNVLYAPAYGTSQIYGSGDNRQLIAGPYCNPEDYDAYDEEDADDMARLAADQATYQEFTNRFSHLGKSPMGLRAITVVEKETLIELVAKQLNDEGDDNSNKITHEEAVACVENYLQDNSREITRINVEPGQWMFQFAGECYDFKEYWQADETGQQAKVPEAFEVYMSLYKMD